MEFKSNVFCVNKPLGWTSADVVRYLKKTFKFKKVGHGGTLDPNASGVLVIGVNNGTKELANLILNDKTYVASIQLGIETDSYDVTGNIVKQEDVNINIDEIKEQINLLTNSNYYQYPPIYSAVKVNGKKLYEYARNNEKVDITPKLVKINSFSNLKYDQLNKVITIEMNVSKGFYVRSFAHDLGIKLGTVACLKTLCRTKSGKYTINDCVQIDFPKN